MTWLRSWFGRWSTTPHMKATNRDERPYLQIAESLAKKGQGKEEPERATKKRRA